MASDPRDYKIDIAGLGGEAQTESGKSGMGRPYLSVKFACCNAYTRIYRDARGTHYAGRCPKCGKAVRFVVGEGGTGERSFVVY